MKNLPLAILGLTLASALAVLVLGVQLGRDEKLIVTDESRVPATAFTARFLGKIEELSGLYESHLLDIRDAVSWHSPIEISSRSRNIIGIEQVTILGGSGRKMVQDVGLESDRDSPLPVPRAVGEESSDDGVLIEVESLTRNDFGPGFRWIDQPGYELHFAARINAEQVAVFRINREKAAMASEEWLKDWLSETLEPLTVADISVLVKNPAGESVTMTGSTAVFDENPPSLLLPVPSRFGDWKIASWDKTETVISYRQPVLIGAATLALMIAVAGFLGFFQQQRAIRLAEQRVSFVNRVSHELRTPLTNILLNIDLASDSLSSENTGAGKRLGLIREETSRLSRLLENVLTFSQREKSENTATESGQQKLRIEPCSLEEVVDELLAQFAPSLERKNLVPEKTDIVKGVQVFADHDALSQIVSNLISNVEKYAPNGEKFEIEISSCESENTAKLAVSDFGPGISESDSARIFRPFTRLKDTTTEGVSGTGLGLAIARDLAESLDGKLELKSRNDATEGARFELTLPLAAENILSLPTAKAS